jgi:hypothetical protein
MVAQLRKLGIEVKVDPGKYPEGESKSTLPTTHGVTEGPRAAKPDADSAAHIHFRRKGLDFLPFAQAFD